MRAKFIYEKFTQDSDPVKDLGIGLYAIHNFSTIKQAAKFLVDALQNITGESDLKKFLDLSNGGGYINSKLWDDKLWPYIQKYVRIKELDYLQWVGTVGNIAAAVRDEIKKRVK